METYTFLRAFADSWHLLFMTLFFLGVIFWAFRPGANRIHQETSSMIFRNDDRPAPVDAKPAAAAATEPREVR
jgi:cytochrome c oxidase cbb3-type subunit IV